MESRAAIEPRTFAAALPLFGSSLSVWMQVLANRTPGAPFTPEDMWAMWRLGMFVSICNAKTALDDWRVHFSKAAAYAACRRFDEARSAISACLRHPEGEAERIHLAARLWHYMPKEALQLVENDSRLYPVVAQDAVIGPNVYIGPLVVIGHGCRIDYNAVIHAGAQVGPNSHIRSSCWLDGGVQLGARVELGAHAIVRMGASVRSGVKIGRGAELGWPQVYGADVADKTVFDVRYDEPIYVYGS